MKSVSIFFERVIFIVITFLRESVSGNTNLIVRLKILKEIN